MFWVLQNELKEPKNALDMKIGYFAPSYKRPEKSTTQICYPQFKLVVKESEADEYRKNGNEVVVCPDRVQGNLCRVRNWILDEFGERFDCIVLVDDDCSYLGRWENRKRIQFEPDELDEFCENMTRLCQDWGFRLWGLNCVIDKGAYREYTPFGTFQYLGGPFHAHLRTSKIRYDEELGLKEDYDITLQHCLHYGGCLRVNFAHYDMKQSEQEGGCATYRNLEEEKRQFFMLQKKWGRDIIRIDKKSRRSFDYNPIMRVPFYGGSRIRSFSRCILDTESRKRPVYG